MPIPAVGPEPPPALDQRIDRASNPDGDAAHSARERLLVASLDEQVDVVVLDRIPDDPETLRVTLVSASDGPTQRRQDMLGAQGSEQGPERHVDRMGRCMRGPSSVRGERSAGDSLAAGSCSFAAPGAGDREGEGALPRAAGAWAGDHT